MILVTYSPGSSLSNLHWVWHTSATDISSALQTCQPLIESIKVKISQYQTRAMRQAAFDRYGLISPSIKKSVLRHMYKDLVGDASAAETTPQAEIDERVRVFFKLEILISSMISMKWMVVGLASLTSSGIRSRNSWRKMWGQPQMTTDILKLSI